MNKKTEAVRKLLQAQGDDPKVIEATIEAASCFWKEEQSNTLRSWIGTITGILALLISILVAWLK